ncbi:phosphatase PAP2 family protein [bacterium]|nr:phosphatase PAP2 family protein [bacterium]
MSAVLVLFIALSLVVVFHFDVITGLDLKILVKIQHLLGFIPLQVPIFISDFGYDLYMLPQLLIIGAVMIKFGRWKEFIGYALITEGVYLSVLILKEIIQRVRPDEIYMKVHKTSFSFPSGHSSVSMFFYLTLIYLINTSVKNKWAKIFIDAFLILWILSVGLSRIYLGVHYPSDVLGGYLVGIFAFLLFYLYSQKIRKT